MAIYPLRRPPHDIKLLKRILLYLLQLSVSNQSNPERITSVKVVLALFRRKQFDQFWIIFLHIFHSDDLETHKKLLQSHTSTLLLFQLSVVICSNSGDIMTHRVPPGLVLEIWVQFNKVLAPFTPIFHLAYHQTPCNFIKIILLHQF